MEPWSPDDPWQERRDPSPGWDEWPPQAPPPDDYALGEPEPPASDPWAESWTDEVPGIPESPPQREFDAGYGGAPEAPYEAANEAPAPAFEPAPVEEREPDRFEPEPAEPAAETAEPEPMPAAEAEPQPYAEAEPEPVEASEVEPQPVAEDQLIDAPRIEPWSPDPDPWGAAWTIPEAAPEPVAEAPTLDDGVQPAPDVPAEVEPEPAEVSEPAAAEAEPGPEVAAEPEPEPEVAAEPEPEPEVAPEPEPEPEVAAEAEPEPMATAPDAADEALAAAAVASSGDAWEADGEPPEPEPAFVPPIWVAATSSEDDAGAEEAAAEFEAPAAEPGAPVAEPDADGEPVAGGTWEADLWAEPEPEDAEAAALPETEPEPEAETAAALADDGVAEPEPEVAAAALAASRIESDAPVDTPWPERTDPTEVLPTTWEPPPPPLPREDADAEPSSGEIRTRLGRAEPEVDDELGEEPNTAEQAVPWLIGVILLLAGMVIVLLALIFAGDASLGGGAGGTPSPTAAVLAPGSGDPSAAPSSTPRATPKPSASASAEPRESAAAGPQYGDLEMVYQGRSAALAPIYLLRRDFTVEAEPQVVTQDPELDVRRFTWSADGTAGAALYADLLVAIDPGVDVRQISDDISAITFGDDAETVYGVRVTADGDNDVASILTVNAATGEERELDRVSYPRPSVGEEAALAEAQFSDEGGSVRLYWMHDGRLRLWILGGGAWTVHPTEGNATALEEAALPVLWAPEGERRIGVAQNGDSSTIRMVDRSGDELASATVTGRVSHLRWSPRGDQVVFTLGRSAPAGGVLQDLYLWNLGEGEDPAPMMITNTGASFGAEWLGSQSRWEEP